MDNRLKWHKDNDKHYTGFEDGAAWGWVYPGEDETWWWETDCTENNTTQYTSGFATAEDAKSAADAAYGERIESLGDPLADMPAINADFFQSLGKHCDLYGNCPYGCQVGDERCMSCPEITEADILSAFNMLEDEE